MQIRKLQTLVQNLTESLPPGTNLARVLSDLLDVSVESAYRRLRGQTSFNLEELLVLRSEFGISIDSLAENNNAISITMKPIFNHRNTIHGYLTDLHSEFSMLLSQPNSLLKIIAADLPFFRLIAHDTLAAFKLFYWQKSILALDKFQNQNFSADCINEETLEICQKLVINYKSCNSIEVWNEQTINGTLKQIEYYVDCAFISSKQLLFDLYYELLRLMNIVGIEAQLGNKQLEVNGSPRHYTLWHCELVMDNNSVLIQNDSFEALAIGFNSFNAFRCTNALMINEYKAWLDSMLSRSTMLSGQADKHRVRFIQSSFDKIMDSAVLRLPEHLMKSLRHKAEMLPR